MEQTRPGRQPEGPLVLRTLAMPKDTNPRGDIFGGWILSQMDIGGGLMAGEVAQGRAVTVSVDHVLFRRPVTVGDTICVHAQLVRVGRSSLDIKLEVWARGLVNIYESEREFVTEGVFRYVAIDQTGKPRVIDDNPPFFTRQPGREDWDRRAILEQTAAVASTGDPGTVGRCGLIS